VALNRRDSGGMARRLAMIFSLAWLVFCALAALGLADRLCETSGCALYRDWSLWDLSLWWWGAGGFGLLAVVAVVSPVTALGLAGPIVLLDAGLLVVMAFLAPCANCLIAGAGFFLVWLCLLAAVRPRGSAGALLAMVWLAALAPNLVALASDGGGWAIYGNTENAVTRVYFSPSCPACRRAVADLATSTPSGVAYIPVSEQPEDVTRLIALHQDVLAGTPFIDAFRSAVRPDFEAGPQGFWRRLRYRALLAHNHAVFRRMGVQAVPYVATVGWRGLPAPAAPQRPMGELRPEPAPAPLPAPDAAPAPGNAPAPASDAPQAAPAP